MQPLIGVTIRIEEKQLQLNRDYMEAVIEAGGIPICIPFVDAKALQQLAQQLDGLLLTGGEDIDPALFNEDPHPKLDEISPDRDQLEMEIIKMFIDMEKPILGLCRGMQVLNVAMGGDLYQDILSQFPSHVSHSQKAPRGYPYHSVEIVEGTLLHQIVNTNVIKTNSYHHQAVRVVKDPMVVSAMAPDGIIEAIESRSHSYVLGVEWHPEGMTQDPYAQRIFETFVTACGRKA